MFEMQPLPYEMDALDPYISPTTMEFHYGKHYKNYVDTLNKLIEDTDFAELSLEEIIKETYQKPEHQAIFNNAGQVYNHQMFWKSMSPQGGAEPKGKLADKIAEAFGSYQGLKDELKKAATTQFGSGWAWLVLNNDDKLEVQKTPNGDTPLARGYKPLINIDVWEHAYYLDYQNRRAEFVDKFLDHLVNWPKI